MPQQRFRQPVRVMDALRVARDLRADHARGVGLVSAVNPPDPAVDDLNVKGTDRRAVVRADGGLARDIERSIHGTGNTAQTRLEGTEGISIRF